MQNQFEDRSLDYCDGWNDGWDDGYDEANSRGGVHNGTKSETKTTTRWQLFWDFIYGRTCTTIRVYDDQVQHLQHKPSVDAQDPDVWAQHFPEENSK